MNLVSTRENKISRTQKLTHWLSLGNVEEIFKSGTVKHFDGEVLDIELKDGKQIKATFQDIEMDPSRRAFGIFRGILTNAIVEIQTDHIDKNGLYHVNVKVDGADFEKVALKQQWATKK